MKEFLMKHKYAILLLGLVAVALLCGMAPVGIAGLAFAGVTTTDLTGGSGIPAKKTNSTFPYRDRITIPIALQVSGDIVNLLNVKAGWLVKQVHVIMVTPSTGSALTADIGVADTAITGYDANGFDSGMSLKGTAGTRTYGIDGTDALITSGGFYAAEDTTIDLTFATVTSAVGDVVIDVIAEVVDCNA